MVIWNMTAVPTGWGLPFGSSGPYPKLNTGCAKPVMTFSR